MISVDEWRKFYSASEFHLPLLQRGFVWKKRQAQQLLDDLSEYQGAERPIYLGNFITRPDRHGGLSTGNVAIIDGQQRLTTITILYIAMRLRAIALGENDFAEDIQTLITVTKGAKSQLRLIARAPMSHALDVATMFDWDGKSWDRPEDVEQDVFDAGKKQFNNIFRYLHTQIRKWSLEQLGRLNDTIDKAQLVHISVDSRSEAAAYFEKNNARGKPLTVAELVKSHLLSLEEEDDKQTSIATKWTQIEKNASTSINKAIRYFYISRYGAVSMIDLYDKLKDRLKEESIDPLQFVNDLYVFSLFFKYWMAKKEMTKDNFYEICGERIPRDRKSLTSIKPILRSINALKYFEFSIAIPIIYSGVQVCMNTPNQIDAMKTLLLLLERFHFVNILVCSKALNQVESVFARFAAQIHQSQELSNEISNDKVGLCDVLT